MSSRSEWTHFRVVLASCGVIAITATVLAVALPVAIASAAHPQTTKTGKITSIIQYEPDGATSVTGTSWEFLSSPPEIKFTSNLTAADVTASVDEATSDGNQIDEGLGVCYEEVGSSNVVDDSSVIPQFAASADSYFVETVAGAVGDLPAGKYYVGVCAFDQNDVLNGAASVTILVTDVSSGVIYNGTKQPPAPGRPKQ